MNEQQKRDMLEQKRNIVKRKKVKGYCWYCTQKFAKGSYKNKRFCDNTCYTRYRCILYTLKTNTQSKLYLTEHKIREKAKLLKRKLSVKGKMEYTMTQAMKQAKNKYLRSLEPDMLIKYVEEHKYQIPDKKLIRKPKKSIWD